MILSLTENIDFNDLLDFFNIKQKDYENTEESFYDYPSYIFYDLILDHIRIHEKKFSDIIKFLDNYDIQDMCRDIFCDGAKCKGLKEKILDEIDSFMNDRVLPLFDDRAIHFYFSLLEGNHDVVVIKLDIENPDHYLSSGMDAFGLFDWNEHCESDKETLRKPYYILRECLHYYEACESKPNLKFRFDWDNMWTFTEDGESLFEEILKRWKEGNIHGTLVTSTEGIDSNRSYTIREIRELMPLDDIPEEYDDCKVFIGYKK